MSGANTQSDVKVHKSQSKQSIKRTANDLQMGKKKDNWTGDKWTK